MGKQWTVERMWDGQPCAILVSGPSMSQEVADAVRYSPMHRVIVVNNTWELAPWADLLYAADPAWWKVFHEKTKAFQGMKATCSAVPYDDVMQLKDTGQEGFDPNPGSIRTGGNSGYQAMHIAAQLGVSRILLCGFDMRGKHWHGRHKEPLRDHGEGIFDKWIKRFSTLAPELAKRNIEVVNCTPGSALTLWPFMPLKQAIEERAAL